MAESQPDPSIFLYTDYRAWLRDWFEARAGRPSVRGFARRAHCSPSLVSAILNGKRVLALDRAENFVDLLDLGEDEARYFLALVQLEEGHASTERERALEVVMAARRFHSARTVDDDTYALMSRWYIWATAELANCAGWRDDPAWIAHRLVPAVTLDQAREALDLLEDIGVLVRDEAGHLGPSTVVWSTGHKPSREVVTVALARLHRELLGMAGEALDTLSQEERRYSTVTFAIPESLRPEIVRRLDHFQEEIVALVAATTGPHERVWQLGTQLFPLSKVAGATGDPEKSPS